MSRIRIVALSWVAVLCSSSPHAQGIGNGVAPVGRPSGTALAIQCPDGTTACLAVPDANNAAFASWPTYNSGQTYTTAQLAGVRSIEMNLTGAGTVTLTDQSGNQMALPYTATGPYQLPFVPASVTFSNGASGVLWMLK